MNEKTNIALVDDHEMFRSGIKLILSQNSNWEIVIEAINGNDFLCQLESFMPDIVLLDISMPELNGYETAKLALEKYPNLKIIVLSMLSDEEYYFKMIEAGAKGFVLKNSGVDELTCAITEVAKGNNYFAQDLLKKVIFRVNNQNVEAQLALNDREKNVLTYICNGYTNKEISDKMCLSVKTIEKYRHSLIAKTETRNTAHLVMHAILNKLIDISSGSS